MRLTNLLNSGAGIAVFVFVLSLTSTAQVTSRPQVAPAPPDLPSYTGFVRFNDGKQLFLNVRRTAYNRVKLRTLGSDQWQTVRFEQFPHGERQRLRRLLMVEEELSPPARTGVRITLKGGQTMEGFLEQDDPEEWPEDVSGNNSSGSEDSGTSSNTSSGGDQEDNEFVLLTREGRQKRLSYSRVTDMELIQVNPLKMVGSKKLYQIERAKHNMNSARSHWELGTLSLHLHLFKRARNHFRKAVQIEPSYMEAAKLRLSIVKGLSSRNGSGSGRTGSTSSPDSGTNTSSSADQDTNQRNSNSGFGSQ